MDGIRSDEVPISQNIPEKRYIEWAMLSDTDKGYAKDNLSYDKTSWNVPGTNSVEGWSFHDLYDDEVEGALHLGLDSDTWDCHINHYYGYWWEDLEKDGHDRHFSVLGWNEDMWDNETSYPETDYMYWDELSPAQQAAAEQVCYFRELWDMIDITNWEV